MELSIFLAKLLGLYLMIVCAAVFLKREKLKIMLEEFEKSHLFIFSSGAMVLLLGLAMVISHTIWELNWRGLITLLGWLTVGKGIIRLYFFEWAQVTSRKVVQSRWYWCIIGLSFIIGLWLAYIGFMK